MRGSYPRKGDPIAPSALRDVLRVPLVGVRKKRGMHLLSDLDSAAWRAYSDEHCEKLGTQVVNEIRAAMAVGLPVRTLQRRIKPLPWGYTVEDLRLRDRTLNALRRGGYVDKNERLERPTVGDLVGIRGLGAYSLVDLLSALEGLRDAAHRELDEGLTKEARKLLRASRGLQVDRDDPRLGVLIQEADARVSSLERLVTLTLTRTRDPRYPGDAADTLRKIRLRMRKLSRCSLEEELHGIVAATGARNPQPAARYLGLDGRGGTTLQVAGDEAALTRERVRQITSRIAKRLSGTAVFSPRLDEAMAFVADEMPATVNDLADRLMRAGIAKQPFHPRGLVEASRLLGREPGFEIAGSGLVVPVHAGALPKEIWQLARKMIARQGVATISEVAATACDHLEAEVDQEMVRIVLVPAEGFRWLSEGDEWFWIDGLRRNRLLNFIEKIMAAAEELDVSELRSAVGRHHRMRGFAPPRRVLLELCSQLDAYIVEGTKVRDDPPIDWTEVLSETEQIFVRVFHEHGPLITGGRLEQLCVERGMNRSTFYVYLGYSPIVARYARGVYGLVGSDIAPGEAEALVPKTRKAKVLHDFGWTSGGDVWLTYEVSENLAKTGVCSIPAAMRSHVAGHSYSVFAEDGARIGSLSVGAEGGAGWGLGPFFARRGGEPGDGLLIMMNRKKETAHVYLRDGVNELAELIEPIEEEQRLPERSEMTADF